MATLNITEYANISTDWKSNLVSSGEEPSITTQSVSYTTSTQSADLQPKTRFVRLIADADVYIAFAPDPTATASSTRLEANVAEYFGVEIVRNRDIKIAAYDGSS